MNRHLLALFLCATGCVVGSVQPTGASVAQAIRDAAMDPDACFRVRELNFTKEDIKFYLTDGFLIFAKPVLGRRLFAVFSAEVEGGDAEVLVMPPHRSERRSLATFAGSPNLDEHFRTAMFLFSDGTGDELFKTAAESGQKNTEMGALMRDRWWSLAHNISGGFEVRLVEDVLSPDRSSGLFFTAVGGTKAGNFDVAYDPYNREQIVVGQYTTRGPAPAFDVWTSFEARSFRTGKRQPPKTFFELSDYRINATLDSGLHMTAVTRAKLTTSAPLRGFALQISANVRISSVTIDGAPVELYDRESARSSAMSGSANGTVVAITPEPLAPGQPHEIEVHHEGDVIVRAGNDVYYVASRGDWYPRSGYHFSNFDMTFRYPKHLTLVATGEPAEDRVEGDVRVTRRKTAAPVRVAGFNLGVYGQLKLARSGYSIEVYGNKALEPSLQPKAPMVMMPSTQFPRRQPDILAPQTPPPPVRPSSRLSELGDKVANAFEFMRGEFGPAPIKTLVVAPIPGTFGQGFPGLVYLSTLTYLHSEERPAVLRNREDDAFFSDLLPAHEVAHQWWGNSVAAAGYQDEWLMESVANYAALLYLEKRHGQRAVEPLLENFRERLLRKMDDGRTVESVGPVVWGTRLQSSLSADAWRTIVYEKGSWIMHMLRRRLGDQRFHQLLTETCRRYANGTITTEQFRQLAESMMGPKAGPEPLSDFFESWVYGTGIPALKLNWSVKGKAPSVRLTGTVSQSGVDDDFAIETPVEVYFAKGAPVTYWVRTSHEPTAFSYALKQTPSRVVLAPNSVLTKH